MKIRSLGLSTGVALAVVALVGCSGKPKTPPRDALVAQLEQEAEALKAENENKDEDLGVKTTWRIMSVDVTEHPDDEVARWRGKITFKIRSETSDMGNDAVDEFEKDFDYVFNPTIEKWVFDYKP